MATAVALGRNSGSASQAPVTLSSPHLEQLINQTSRCLLQPLSFFVSWQGVLTLAYSGFSPALVQLKQQINETLPELPKEQPGSKWPKTSLAALKDNVRLTPDQLQLLNEICSAECRSFQSEGSTMDQAVRVDQLSVVFYGCRCLERVLSRQVIALSGGLDTRGPSSDERAHVQAIVAEADHPAYWFQASRDGSREAHYMSPALGVTLANELHLMRPRKVSVDGTDRPLHHPLLDSIRSFRQRVELVLPGMYTWFNEESLHITLRSLLG